MHGRSNVFRDAASQTLMDKEGKVVICDKNSDLLFVYTLLYSHLISILAHLS